LSYNSKAYLADCISQLATALQSFPGSEILVLDNGSTDGSTDVLRALQQDFRELLKVRFSSVNLGTTASRNWALRQASGDYILVLDSDAFISAQALLALVHVLEQEPACGIAVPRIVYPDGRLQLSTDTFPTLTRKATRFLALRRLEEQATIELRHRQPVDYAISACWLMRRTLLESVGLLDEKIFYSPEDVDYCLRVWKAGYTILYEPGVSVVHDAQEISRGWRLNRFTFRHIAGLLYYFRKHRYAFGLRRLYRQLGR